MEDAVEEAFASLRLLHGIPAEADADVREGITSNLAEGDFLPLDEVDGHGKHSFSHLMLLRMNWRKDAGFRVWMSTVPGPRNRQTSPSPEV